MCLLVHSCRRKLKVIHVVETEREGWSVCGYANMQKLS